MIGLQKIILIFIIPCTFIFAQEDTLKSIEPSIENLLEESSIDDEDSQLYDLIEELVQNPVNINKASNEDLLVIPFINFRIAQVIISHRTQYGQFFSTNELFSIKELDEETVRKIIPFLSISEKKIIEDEQSAGDLLNFQLQYRARSIMDLQTRRGFSEDKYEGSKIKSYNRIRIKNEGHYQAGVLVEKDAGERSFTDFYTFFIQAENIGFNNKFLAGDYLVEFGQGLALWSPYAFSKGSDAAGPLLKKERYIIPYTSSDENQFFRGGAASLNFGNLNLTAFYSNKKIDANIDTISGYVTSTPLDGYHRTNNEINKKRKLDENICGATISYKLYDIIDLNLLYYKTKYNSQLAASDVFDLSCNEFNFYSIAYKSYWGKLFFSGEFAYNGKSVASINNADL